MSQSPFARAFITSACVAGAVFTASTLPLALTKSKVVDIELQNQTLFSSEVQDLATPYLSLSGAFSIALGFGVFGILGWQNSARKLSRIQGESTELARELAIHQAELERIKFSESRLKTQSLATFLIPDTAPNPGRGAGVAGLPQMQTAVASKADDLSTTSPQPEHLLQQVSMVQGQGNLQQSFTPNTPQPFVENGTPQSGIEPKGEILTNLLHQLSQLSQQVEELRDTKTNGLAA